MIDAVRHRRRYSAATTDISYGPHGRSNLLDIWRRPDLPEGHRAPVLIQVPGGGWSINDKRGQAYPLMSRMTELGWICVSINYSRSPRNAWPAHIVDVKRAIAWVRENIAGYGGDPDFIAITGGSAGGHLSSLAALTAGDPQYQPGFEDADTSVQAAAPHYGVYDLTDETAMHPLMMPLLEHVVMQTSRRADRQVFEQASPMYRVHRDAPPFFILHGRNDAVVPSPQAAASAPRCARRGRAPSPTRSFPTPTTLSTPSPRCAASCLPKPSRPSWASCTAATSQPAAPAGAPPWARQAEQAVIRLHHRRSPTSVGERRDPAGRRIDW